MTRNMAETGLHSAARPGCPIGRNACDQFSFPKDMLHIFSILVLMAVSNTSSSSLHLVHYAVNMSLGIDRQIFKMKNA